MRDLLARRALFVQLVAIGLFDEIICLSRNHWKRHPGKGFDLRSCGSRGGRPAQASCLFETSTTVPVLASLFPHFPTSGGCRQ
jgi:hypothetical protein